MAFELPKEAIDLASKEPVAAPSAAGFSLPKEAVIAGADELANDDSFDPISFALDNPEQVALAKEAAWRKKKLPWTKERLQKLPGVAWDAGTGIVKDFGAGAGEIAADVVTQVTDESQANRDRAATQQMARAQLVENNTETFFNKLFGPNTWLGKLFEGGGANMAVGQALFTGGGATSGGMSLLEHSLAAQKESRESIGEREKNPRGAFDKDFDYRLQLAGRERELLKGNVQDDGFVADMVGVAGDLGQRAEAAKGTLNPIEATKRYFNEETQPAKPTELFKSGEELAAAGAPVHSEGIRTGAVTSDWLNAVPMHVPKVAPALNKVAGAAMRLPKAVAGEIIERIPGSLKRKVLGGAATVGGGALTYDLYNDPEKALQRLGIAAGVGVGIGGAKLFGHILDNGGAKFLDPKHVSAAERAGAEAMMDINARGGGALEKMTNKAMNIADAERMATRAVQGVAAAPGGVLPMLAATDSPEEAASMLGGGIGFGAMAGATAYNPVKGFRPDVVQAVDTILRDNGAKKTYGTELDAKHAAWMKNAPDWVRDGVNSYRGFFDGFKVNGKEPQIYVLNGADFGAEVSKRRPDIAPDLAQNQRGFASKDGTILINGDYGGEASGILGHEGTGHLATESIMRVLAPELTKSLQDAATKGLLNADGTPSPQLKKFVDAYNKEFDPSGKTKEIETSEHAVSEWLAEQARSILDGDGSPAKYAAGESVREKIADNLGDYFKGIFGTKEAFDREQLPGIAGEYRNLLFEMGRFGNRARSGEDIYGAPTPEAAAPADGGTPPATPGKPAPDAGRPVVTPARTPDEVNRTARLGALAVDEAAVDAARDKARQDAIDAEKQRRGKRPMSEKSEADVAEQAGKDFDAQLERYLAALEGEGVTHPDGMDIIEAIRLNELAPDGNLPRWKRWAGQPGDRPAAPRADRPDRIIEEPQEGEAYPYQATSEEVAGLQERGWLPEEIAAMPQSQVEVELATPAPAAEPAAVPAGTPATPGAQLSGVQPAGSPEAPAGSPSGALSGVQPAAAPESGARPATPAATPGDRPAQPVRVSVDQINERLKAAEDAARQAEAGKKRKNEETRAKATDKAVKEARIRALADIATQDASGDADLLQVRKDDKGRERITGKLDTSIESHRMLADEMGLTQEDIDVVNQFQNGKTIYVDYLSAKNLAPEDVTGKQRRKEYKLNPPSERGDATGTLQKNKAILGVTFSVSKGGGAVIKGVSVDKFLSNAKKLLDFAQAHKGEFSDVEYTGINDPRLLQDLQGYIENHKNGWKGNGSGTVKGENVTPGYQPYVIPAGRFDLLNAAFHADVSTKVDSNRADTRQNAMDAQARALENDWKVDDASGDTNDFRAHINESGKLVFKNDKGEVRQGTGEVLETVWENLVPDMVLNVSEAPLGARDIVRDAGFTGDAGKVFEGGKLPNFKNVEAGFMPGRGAQEGQLSDFGNPDEPSIKSKVGDYPVVRKGATVGGLVVRSEVPNRSSIRSSFDNPETLRGIREIPISELRDANSEGYASADDSARVKKLADEIKDSGEIAPLIVGIDENGQAYVVEGNHRLEALAVNGVERVPALVVREKVEHQVSKRGNSDTPYFVHRAGSDKPISWHATPDEAWNAAESLDDGGKFMPGSKEGQLSEFGKQPEQDALGFTSALRKVITDKLPNKASVDQIRATLDPAKSGVKKEELDWMGLPEFLEGKKTVTKKELLDFVEANKVELKEVAKGGTQDTSKLPEGAELVELFDDTWQVVRGDDILGEGETQEGAIENSHGKARDNDTKFGQWRLEGGENYKEVLLTLPVNDGKDLGYRVEQINNPNSIQDGFWHLVDKDGNEITSPAPNRAYAEQMKLRWEEEDSIKAANFISSHWDEPNVIAHIRQADFWDTEGSRVRLIEEIQSDWHQKGRKEGYRPDELEKRINATQEEFDAHVAKMGEMPFSEYSKIESEIFQRLENLKSLQNGVPDAPFKKTWHELAFKRALRQAVEDGADKIAWIDGQTAADRFNISKQVDEIQYSRLDNGNYEIAAMKGGDDVMSADYPPEKLPDVVGKEVAEKIINGEGEEKTYSGTDAKYRVLKGDNLKVGGAGMKGFYDKIIPDFVKKYVKKWGAKVETTEVVTKPGNERTALSFDKWHQQQYGEEFGALTENADARIEEYNAYIKGIEDTPETETVHSVTITPAMRESAKAGQSLFMPGSGNKGQLSEFGNPQDEPSIKSKVGGRFLPEEDYRGEHGAPDRDTGAPLHKLNENGIYPDDVYSLGAKHYGTGDPQADAEAFGVINSVKGKPNAKVTVYRAVPRVKSNADKIAELEEHKRQIMRRGKIPKGVDTPFTPSRYYEWASNEIERLSALPETATPITAINPGDWVTITRSYAREHGESNLNGDYKILSKKIPAKDLVTSGDSVLEWGYVPETPSAKPKGGKGQLSGFGEKKEKPKFPPVKGLDNEQVKSEPFKNWFGESKIVDDKGNPLVVYHGTSKNFNKFNTKKATQGIIWFTTDKSKIEAGEAGAQGSGKIMELFAKVENPAGWKEYENKMLFQLKHEGFDGVILRDSDGHYDGFVFDPKKLKSATKNKGTFDPDNADIRFMPGSKERQIPDFGGNKDAQKNFKAWKGKAKVVRSGESIDDIKPGDSVVIEGFHGTTHTFEIVDPSRANIENDMGRGFYVSNKPDDVSTNYAGEGPDLTNRIERRMEQIENDIFDLSPEEVAEHYSISEDDAYLLLSEPKYGSDEYKQVDEIKRSLAKRELTSHEGATMKVFVKLEKPLKLGGKEEYWDSEYNEETGESSGRVMEFIESLRDAAADYGEDIDTSPLDDFTYEGTTPSKAIQAAREIVGEISDPDTGELAGNEIIRAAIERMGYDGIIDGTVNEKFGTKRKFGKPMTGIDESTFHVIAFKPEQVKSATGNAGTFDPNNPSMNAMPGSAPRRTWFVRDGKRVTAARQEDGKFAPKKPSLANLAPVGVASASESDRNRKQLESFK